MTGSAVGSLVCLGVMALGLIPLMISRRRLALANAVESTPLIPLNEVKSGRVATSGTIEADGEVHLFSAVTGKKCVYWEVIVDENNGGDIERLASQRTGVKVRLADGSTHCDIDFTGARVSHDAPYQQVHDTHVTADGIRSFLKRHMGFLNRPRSLQTLRFRETLVAVGHRVNIYGTAVLAPSGQPMFSRSAGPLFVMLGTAEAATKELRHDARLYRQAAFTIWAIGVTGLAAFLWQRGLA